MCDMSIKRCVLNRYIKIVLLITQTNIFSKKILAQNFLPFQGIFTNLLLLPNDNTQIIGMCLERLKKNLKSFEKILNLKTGTRRI